MSSILYERDVGKSLAKMSSVLSGVSWFVCWASLPYGIGGRKGSQMTQWPLSGQREDG